MILVSLGGSGSTYIRAIQAPKYYESSHWGIDVDFKPRWWPEGNMCPIDSYQQKPNSCIAYHLRRRTGFIVNQQKSIEENLLEYMNKRQNENSFSSYTFAATFNFFSQNRFKDVVFLMRHPVDQVVSYIHPELGTHGEFAFRDGLDITTLDGMMKFMRVWTALANEYWLLCAASLTPKLIRFDRWQEDVKQLLSKQRKLFDGFNGTNTHRGVLPKEIEHFAISLWKKSGLWDK